ncbi:MAG: 4-hydroxy-tetrahydrodipicolinate synthase [Candidatus Eisenbacteria bacterium]
MFTGSIVATVTPMKDGKVDERSLRGLLRMHAESGTAGIVPAGCTGEAATLSSEERLRMLAVCLEEVGDALSVIPGTGSNSTTETLHLTKTAEAAGAHGALIITPYYNKPTPEGMYRHYREVALEVGIPIILYNVPSRTGVNLLPETVARLSEIENIVAIKEASGSVDQVSEIAELCDITILSGDDPLTLPMMSVGAKGVVSVVANVLPRMVSEMVGAYPGRPARAVELHHALRPISKALFLETSPGPIKYAMAELGLIASGELRAPLAEVTEQTKQMMADALDAIRSARG